MPTPVWTAGTLKLPGDLVQPVSVVAPASSALTNAGFESGDSGWAKGAGWTIQNNPTNGAFAGTWAGVFVQPVNDAAVRVIGNNAVAACVPGTTITASGMVNLDGPSEQFQAWVRLQWFDAGMVALAPSDGNHIVRPQQDWRSSTVTGTAPAGAAYVQLQCATSATNYSPTPTVRFDTATWNYAVAAVPAGLVYKAVQAAAGTTAASEPSWPASLGVQVIDGGVTWEAVQASRVEWTAYPILLSGATEPEWPEGVGSSIVDGSIIWETVSRHVEDAKCPHSKFVKIIANKVYAGDGDIIRYSATANPLDWSTADDAGYLPYGLNPHGGSPVAALGEYRSNLVAFNAGGFQMWQVDEDPANAALLDAMPIGSTWHRALFSVGDDLFLLTPPGVRTIGIAGASTNLASGQDVGEPIDPLVQDAIRVAEANDSRVVSTYSPAEGQYWLAFADYPAPPPSISGDVPDGYVGDVVTGTYVVTGGVLPYSAITVTSGTFPAGLTLAADGSYSGTLTTKASYAWTVGGTDADGTAFSLADAAAVGQANEWDATRVFASYALSDGNRTVTQAIDGTNSGNQIAVNGQSSGKWYFEVQGAGQSTGSPTGYFGIGELAFAPGGGQIGSGGGNGAGMGSHGWAVKDGVTAPRIAAPYPGNLRCMVAFDADTGKLWFGADGVWFNSGDPAAGTAPFYTMLAGTYYPAVSLNQINCAYTICTTDAQALHTPPAGFERWLQ